jgi:lambda repressor-like predicted transcriptional regulator
MAQAKTKTKPAASGPRWVPLAEAAERAGVNPSTLRNWARRGKVESRIAAGSGGPKKLVRLDDVVAKASALADRNGVDKEESGAKDPKPVAGKRRKDQPKDKTEKALDSEGWVTLKTAAETAGISVSTLRNWYRKDLIESKTEQGPNGLQRLVRESEVQQRAGVKDGAAPSDERPGSIEEEIGAQLVPVMKALPDLIAELAAARERAGRAEAKAEFLSEQLAELRSNRDESGTVRGALEQENRILEQRLARLQTQAEQMARQLAAAEKAQTLAPQETDESDDAEDVAISSMTPEEEDEYLALTQRWRARRKRKKAAKKEARLQKKLDKLG